MRLVGEEAARLNTGRLVRAVRPRRRCFAGSLLVGRSQQPVDSARRGVLTAIFAPRANATVGRLFPAIGWGDILTLRRGLVRAPGQRQCAYRITMQRVGQAPLLAIWLRHPRAEQVLKLVPATCSLQTIKAQHAGRLWGVCHPMPLGLSLASEINTTAFLFLYLCALPATFTAMASSNLSASHSTSWPSISHRRHLKRRCLYLRNDPALVGAGVQVTFSVK